MIKIVIHKVSLPNTYSKEFDSISEALIFIKGRCCGSCIRGDECQYDLDLTECDDFREFFGTSCGLEYEWELVDK